MRKKKTYKIKHAETHKLSKSKCKEEQKICILYIFFLLLFFPKRTNRRELCMKGAEWRWTKSSRRTRRRRSGDGFVASCTCTNRIYIIKIHIIIVVGAIIL